MSPSNYLKHLKDSLQHHIAWAGGASFLAFLAQLLF